VNRGKKTTIFKLAKLSDFQTGPDNYYWATGDFAAQPAYVTGRMKTSHRWAIQNQPL